MGLGELAAVGIGELAAVDIAEDSGDSEDSVDAVEVHHYLVVVDIQAAEYYQVG